MTITAVDPLAEDIDILARTAWAEARSHGLDGMAAVLNVIANRVAQPGWWGDDWRSVCKSPWQFSCWNATEVARNRITKVTLDDPHFFDASMLAHDCAAGRLRDRTNGADHYYAEYIKEPKWVNGRTPRLIVGPMGQRHFFYRVGMRGDKR